jgi:hypothetical protein
VDAAQGQVLSPQALDLALHLGGGHQSNPAPA